MTDYLFQLGLVGYPLLFCSSVGTTIIIERFILLIRTFALPKPLINEIMNYSSEAMPDTVTAQLQKNLFGKVVLEFFDKRHLPANEREELFSMELSEIEQRLSRFLPLLKIIATLSPLLGLLGTILGMIGTFESIAKVNGPVTPALISDGISQALFSTAGGLMIAIPCLLIYSLYQMRISQLMKQFSQQLNLLHLHFDQGQAS